MIRIAVVDDNIATCGRIEKTMDIFASTYQLKIEVEPYTTSDSFLKAIQEHQETYDMIFLDIELDEKTGIDLANYIRYVKQDELQSIVYISGKSTYSISLHDTHPLDFLVKPIRDDQLEKVLIRYLKMAHLWNDVFSYQVGGDTLKVKISDISYFSIENKEIAIHTRNGVDYFRGSMRQVEQKLKKFGFLFIHRSYLVNPAYISVYEYDRVILYDHTELPIGSSRRKEICQKRMELQKKERYE